MRESYARALELRNAAASSACRLPPETIANVFSYLQAMWPMELKRDKNTTLNEDSEDSEKVFYFTMAWYNVAHVCRLWRQVNIGVLGGLCACIENSVIGRSYSTVMVHDCLHGCTSRLPPDRHDTDPRITHRTLTTEPSSRHRRSGIDDQVDSQADGLLASLDHCACFKTC